MIIQVERHVPAQHGLQQSEPRFRFEAYGESPEESGMNDLTQIGFDYAALPVDVSSSLQLRADRFVAVRNRAIYEMGKELYEAQQELAQHKIGCFQAWVESLGVSYQTGYDLISVYQHAGSDIIKLFDNKKLNQTVTVMLSRPSISNSYLQVRVFYLYRRLKPSLYRPSFQTKSGLSPEFTGGLKPSSR